MPFIRNLFLFCCFFPYIAFLPIFETDLQPYALLLATVLFTISKDRKPRELWFLMLPGLFCFGLLLADEISLFGLRVTASYISIWLISSATYSVLRADGGVGLIKRHLNWSVYLWLVVGCIQFFFDKTFASSVVPNMSTDHARGVTSLATEPSFYGIMCIFFLLLNYTFNNNNRILAAIILFQLIFLAQSSVAILMIVFLPVYAFIFMSSRKALIFTALFVVFLPAMSSWALMTFEDNRAIYLLQSILNDPLSVLNNDVSVNARMSHMLFSLYGFFDNWLLPHGFNNFDEYVAKSLFSSNSGYIWLGLIQKDVKIMSGYGAALFELGILGLILPIAITLIIRRAYCNDFRKFLVLSFFLNTILFGAIQLSLPLLAVLIGSYSFAATVAPKGNTPIIRGLDK